MSAIRVPREMCRVEDSKSSREDGTPTSRANDCHTLCPSLSATMPAFLYLPLFLAHPKTLF
jgi:hypothetical protein